MPGRSLNDTERRLAKWWGNDLTHFDYPQLRAIDVSGQSPGLRGITGLKVEFAYPVSVLSGPNGSGKTTVLGLAALGFHGVDGHFPQLARRQARSGEDFSYYTFQDFFFRGPGDPDVTGVQIGWRYRQAPELSISKQSDKWMRYERRPPRPVQYFGIGRAVPAIEQAVLRSHFGQRGRPNEVALSNEAVRYVSRILGRPYSKAHALSSARWGVRRCANGRANYSSFNMGAGEDILFDLIGSIVAMPKGSLVVIEEIEVGIHAGALTALAEVLLEIAWVKKLQIIISSHSERFVDAMPRPARILLRRHGASHDVLYGPSTEFVFSSLSGVATPELLIYCEDKFAQRLIEAALPIYSRARVRVLPVGDKAALATQAECHIRDGDNPRCIVVFDGDVSESEALRLVAPSNERVSPSQISWMRLPGDMAPEAFVASQVADDTEVAEAIAGDLGLHVDELRALLERAAAGADHHDIVREVARSVGVSEDEVAVALCRGVARSGEGIRLLRSNIDSALDGL